MKKDVVIIGAGITGLTLAHQLGKSELDFLILEKEQRSGGKILSTRAEGYICECGPNTILYRGDALITLIRELGLESELVFANDRHSKNRYILNHSGIEKLPLSPGSFLNSGLLSGKSKWRVITDYFRKTPVDIEKASVAEYFAARYGESVVSNIIDPFVTGIYAGDPYNMSFRYSFPKLYELEKEYGNLIRGFMKNTGKTRRSGKEQKGIFSFSEGLKTLTDRLEGKSGNKILKGAEVTRIIHERHSYRIQYTRDGQPESLVADRVIDTRSIAQSFISLGIEKKPAEPVYVPIISLHLGFSNTATSNVPHGFGLLTTRNSNRSYLGIIFSSSIFPHVAPEGFDLFTILIGGSRRPGISQKDQAEVINQVICEFCHDMEIDRDPDFQNVHYWHDAIPQYNLGHEVVLEEINAFTDQYPGYFLAGNYHKGVSIGDRVDYAFELADKLTDRG